MINEIKVIVEILKNYEGALSDGYKFYCGEDKVDRTLEELAGDIVEELAACKLTDMVENKYGD